MLDVSNDLHFQSKKAKCVLLLLTNSLGSSFQQQLTGQRVLFNQELASTKHLVLETACLLPARHEQEICKWFEADKMDIWVHETFPSFTLKYIWGRWKGRSS